MEGDAVPTPAQHGAVLSHMDALPNGTMLGEFEVQGLLGVGGFGMVYRGYDHSLHRAVAIKEYMPTSLVGRDASLQVSARSTADTQSFETGLASFMAEARLLAKFDHPSLVKVYRVWEENSTAYMAMPLYKGVTLKQARAQMSGPPPETWLRVVMWSVLEALKILHANGTLHRDVSPDNIFLQDVGPPVLLDLGAARHAVVESSRKHTAILKVNYAPIEQYADAHDLKEGPWTDLYALAAVVHGCLCNEAPLPATFRAVRDRMPSIASVVKTVENHFGQNYSSAFVRAIDHALAIQPTKRTKDAEAFAKELRLRTPKRIATFDWRAQLGEFVVLGKTSTAPHGQADTPTRPATASDHPLTFKPSNGWIKRLEMAGATIKRHALGLSLMLLGVVLLVFAVVRGLHSEQQASLRERFEKPVPPTTPMAPPSQQMAASPASSPDSSSIVTVLAAPNTLPVARPSQPSSTAGFDAATLAPSANDSKAGFKTPAHGGKTPASASKTASTTKKPSGRAAESEVGVPAQSPNPAICAGANVFTRSMCVYRECQKPENANQPVCIEDRKRWENRDRLP